MRADVLAGEGERALIHRVHRRVDEVFDVDGGGVAADDGGGVEGVDGGLDEDVGDGEHRALNSGGYAYAQNADELGLDYAQAAEPDAVAGLGLHEAADNEEGGEGLADHGADGDARHAHVEGQHEEEV